MQPLKIFRHPKGIMREKVILQNLKAGSREALGLLWQDHSSHVLNLAFRMMKDRDLAEDILMDVFVQVPKAVQSFRGESAVSTWLYKLTVNACLMKLRALKRHRELEEEHLELIVEEALGKGGEKSHDEPGKVTANVNLENSPVNANAIVLHDASEYDPELLALGLNELPAESRSMLWLKDAEDLEVKDLMEIFKMPEGTIKARLSRARNFIRNYLKERKIYA